jgi:hypothetical protein
MCPSSQRNFIPFDALFNFIIGKYCKRTYKKVLEIFGCQLPKKIFVFCVTLSLHVQDNPLGLSPHVVDERE